MPTENHNSFRNSRDVIVVRIGESYSSRYKRGVVRLAIENWASVTICRFFVTIGRDLFMVL
jgi:hypothetical protein